MLAFVEDEKDVLIFHEPIAVSIISLLKFDPLWVLCWSKTYIFCFPAIWNIVMVHLLQHREILRVSSLAQQLWSYWFLLLITHIINSIIFKDTIDIFCQKFSTFPLRRVSLFSSLNLTIVVECVTLLNSLEENVHTVIVFQNNGVIKGV